MTDKKNIINPDEDFELDGLSNFVEELNKKGDDLSNKDKNDENSFLDTDDLPSILGSNDDDLNLDDLDLNNDDLDNMGFETDNHDDFNSSSLNDENENENENKNLLDEDNISSEEFNSLIESSSDNKDFEFDDGINDLDLSGITEMELPKDDFEDTSNANSWTNVDDSIDDLSNLEDFEFEENSSDPVISRDMNDSVSDGFDNFESDEGNSNINFDELPEEIFNDETHVDKDFQESELSEEWGNDHNLHDEHEFHNQDIDNLLDEPEVIDEPILPVPVKESFLSKMKKKFSSKKNKKEESGNDDLNVESTREEDSYINLDHDTDHDSDSGINRDRDVLLNDEQDEPNEIEDEQNKKIKKGNILKLSLLAVVIAAVAGGTYYVKNNDISFGSENLDESSDTDISSNTVIDETIENSATIPTHSQIGNGVVIPKQNVGLSSVQIDDLKKELLSQMSSDKNALEQRLNSLERENSMLKNVINQVQSSIDPDQINRFKIEFNDLDSKTKQLEVQFGDDQSANKVMATNFFTVIKKLNEDIQQISATTARQDSLDEQTKRIDNTFKQLVKMKDKAAEDNITYRVDLIEKRMKFRNPNNDRTFEDKNNVRKVLSEGLFEGDTLKQEQPIPDVKYKYSFVGMIEGVIYLKNQSGDIKDFKVGDVLPGYGEVLKINDNGSIETEKLGTTSFK